MDWLLSHVPSRGNTPPPIQGQQPNSGTLPVMPSVQYVYDPTFMAHGMGYGYNPTAAFWMTPPPAKTNSSLESTSNRSATGRGATDSAHSTAKQIPGTPFDDVQRRLSLEAGQHSQLPPRHVPRKASSTHAQDDSLLATSPSKQAQHTLQSMPSSQSMPCLSNLTGKTPRQQRRVSDEAHIGLAAA